MVTAGRARTFVIWARFFWLNAIRCYDLDPNALSAIAADIGPRPSELNQDLSLRTQPDAIREARFWFDDYGIEWRG